MFNTPLPIVLEVREETSPDYVEGMLDNHLATFEKESSPQFSESSLSTSPLSDCEHPTSPFYTSPYQHQDDIPEEEGDSHGGEEEEESSEEEPLTNRKDEIEEGVIEDQQETPPDHPEEVVISFQEEREGTPEIIASDITLEVTKPEELIEEVVMEESQAEEGDLNTVAGDLKTADPETEVTTTPAEEVAITAVNDSENMIPTTGDAVLRTENVVTTGTGVVTNDIEVVSTETEVVTTETEVVTTETEVVIKVEKVDDDKENSHPRDGGQEEARPPKKPARNKLSSASFNR
eukprot:sb/3467629/